MLFIVLHHPTNMNHRAFNVHQQIPYWVVFDNEFSVAIFCNSAVKQIFVPMSSFLNVPISSCPLCSDVLMFQCPRVLMSHVLKSPCILCSHVLMSLCPHVPMSSCSQVPISTSPIIHHFRKLPIGYNSNPRKFGIQRMLFSVRHHQSVAAASTTFSLRQNASVCVDRASRQPKAM